MKIQFQVSAFAFLFFLGLCSCPSFGQTCTASAQVTTDINITSITWVGAGGVSAATCANIINGSDATTVADFFCNVANGVTITISNNITIHGNFDIPSGSTGDNSSLKVDGGGSPITMHIVAAGASLGDLGDNTNNNIQYNVVATTDHILVDGTLYGKNNNQFIGNGSIGGGALNVKNGTTCGTPCPVSGNFASCTDGAGTFCATYGVPITLSSFDGHVKDQVVELQWATGSEINFDHFVLERSANGKTFSELAEIKGSGFSNTRKNYAYTDHSPFIGNSYYRLTSIDFDGYTEVFNNKVVRVTVNAGKNFFIAPNPLEGNKLKGGVNFDASSTQVVIIYNRMGAVVDRFTVNSEAFELQLPNLANGIYIAQIQADGFTKSVRFTVNQ